MAFKRTTASANTESLPWVAEYAKALDRKTAKQFNLQTFEVTSVLKPKSGKGYVMTIGQQFNAFIWGNSPDGKAMKEFLDGQTTDVPCILTNQDMKSGFEFGLDDERKGKAVEISDCRWMIFTDAVGKTEQEGNLAVDSIRGSTRPQIVAPNSPIK